MHFTFARSVSIIQSRANSSDWMRNCRPQAKDKGGGWQSVQSQEELLIASTSAHPLVDEMIKQGRDGGRKRGQQGNPC